MNEYTQKAVRIADQYHLDRLKAKLADVSPPEDVPYLRCAVVSESNRLPNLIAGQDLLPDRLLMSEQACVCITFDGSEDEMETLHGDSPVWNDVPVRFYVIPWDRAFDEQRAPTAQTKNMDVILFSMDAAAAFRRSLMDCIRAAQVWDKMVVIEGIEKVPEEEMEAFVAQCLRRTEHLNMRREQLALWNGENSEDVLDRITACLLSGRAQGAPAADLSAFRQARFEQRIRKQIAEEMCAALQEKISELRAELEAELETLGMQAEARTRLRQAEELLEGWQAAFAASLQSDLEGELEELRQHTEHSLEAMPLTQKRLDAEAEELRKQWSSFVDSEYTELELSLLSQVSSLNEGAGIPGAGDVDRTLPEPVIDAPKGLRWHPALLAGVGAAAWLCAGLMVTLLLGIPLLVITQGSDKKKAADLFAKANQRAAEEIRKAFQEDMERCRRNVMLALRQEAAEGSEARMDRVRSLSSTMDLLGALLKEYENDR